MPLQPGSTLGPYEIQAPLGAGGMGEVYKARDTRLDRTVAIKVLPEHVASDPDLQQRFEREAKTISSLNHPHICTLYDVGEHEGTSFLVMEYLEGDTLAQRLKKGALPLAHALKVATEIADALDKAHRQGITHRDLKPGNIMLTKAGAKLLDFGLAKLRPPGTVGADGFSAAVTASEPLTARGTLLGTLQYMAPEQLEGKDADHRTDIFAFGAVVYEMATGQRAFSGESQASLIGAILKDEPVPMSSLQTMTPPALDFVVNTCLAKDPDDRWQSAGDIGRQVQGIIEGGSLSGVSVPTTAATGRRGWRQAVPWMLAALLVGSLITGVTVWTAIRPGPPSPRPLARFVITTPPDGPLRRWGNTPEVAISPSGTVVYGSDSSTAEFGPAIGRTGLHVRRIDQIAATLLRGTEGGSSPFLSPDGEEVGFWDGTTLKRVSVSGGTAVDICDLGERPRGVSWGPDGRIIFGTGTPSGLWEVAVSGGEPVPLTTTDPEVNHDWPHILPGGRAVLFTILTGDQGSGSDNSGSTRPPGYEQAQIAVLNLDTSEHTVLLPAGSNPRYSPTGHIVYGLDGVLWAVGFDLDQLALTTLNPVSVLTDVNTKASGAANFGLSANGSIVYVPGTVRDPRADPRMFVWVDREGREEPTAPPAQPYNEFRLSPDGTQVAARVNANVSVHDLVSGAGVRLLDPDTSGLFPTWTPNGHRVAYGGRTMSWRAANGTGAVDVLAASDGNSLSPYAFTPDGTKLIFYQQDDLGVLSLEDRTPRLLWGETPARERNADLSPDGRWLAYQSDETGQHEVWVKPFPNVDDGSWQISIDGGMWPLWNRHGGQELFYLAPEGMTAVAVETEPTFKQGTSEVLFDTARYEGDTNRNRRMDVSPDGQHFLMFKEGSGLEENDAPAHIIIELNWLDELQRLVPSP